MTQVVTGSNRSIWMSSLFFYPGAIVFLVGGYFLLENRHVRVGADYWLVLLSGCILFVMGGWALLQGTVQVLWGIIERTQSHLNLLTAWGTIVSLDAKRIRRLRDVRVLDVVSSKVLECTLYQHGKRFFVAADLNVIPANGPKGRIQ